MTDTAPQSDQIRQNNQANRPQGNRPNRPQTVWNVVKTFSDPKSGIAVVVSKSEGLNPMFSFVIGRLREDGSVAFNMQFRVNRKSPTFELETDPVAVISDLMKQAQEFAVMEMQWNWSQRVDEQIERESRRMDGGQTKPGGNTIRHPGKTARDKLKHTRKTP